MHLVYRGGLNKYDPEGFRKSYFYEYSEIIKKLISQEKRVCFVTLAKPDGHFDKHITPQFGNSMDIVNHTTISVDWRIYDLIFLCGGDELQLKNELLKKDFSFQKLKDSVVILGDSAGAMIMVKYFYHAPDERIITSFEEGLRPEIPTIVAVHVNNPRYVTERLTASVEAFAQKHNLSILKLNENETKEFSFENQEFIDCDFRSLFPSLF